MQPEGGVERANAILGVQYQQGVRCRYLTSGTEEGKGMVGAARSSRLSIRPTLPNICVPNTKGLCRFERTHAPGYIHRNGQGRLRSDGHIVGLVAAE